MDTFIAITLAGLINDCVLLSVESTPLRLRHDLGKYCKRVDSGDSGVSSKIGRHFLEDVTQVNFSRVGPTL